MKRSGEPQINLLNVDTYILFMSTEVNQNGIKS
jgi:hypothetical protein